MHVQRYRGRISGPLLDRIDLRVELAPPTLDELSPTRRSAPAPELAGAALKAKVQLARARQLARQGPKRNADLDADELDRCVPLDTPLRSLLARAARSHGLSARALQSLRRVARTIADLDDAAEPGTRHFAQALSLRTPIL